MLWWKKESWQKKVWEPLDYLHCMQSVRVHALHFQIGHKGLSRLHPSRFFSCLRVLTKIMYNWKVRKGRSMHQCFYDGWTAKRVCVVKTLMHGATSLLAFPFPNRSQWRWLSMPVIAWINAAKGWDIGLFSFYPLRPNGSTKITTIIPQIVADNNNHRKKENDFMFWKNVLDQATE